MAGNGGIIGPANTPSTSVASGIWSLAEAQEAQGGGIWPSTPAYTIEYLVVAGAGGGAGGGGGNFEDSGSGFQSFAAGGGGGRILPGVGGSAQCGPGAFGYGGGAGGSAGNAGTTGCNNGFGGGGGWGARGGQNGGLGGAAITGTAITVTNNGTIYGAIS